MRCFFSLFRVTGSVWSVGTIDRKRERATSAISNERDTGEKRRGREASLFSLLDPDHRLRRKRKRCFNIRPSPNTNLSSRYIKIQPWTIDLSTRFWGINPTNVSVSRFLKTNFVLYLSYEISFSCKFFIFIRMVIVHQTSLWWKGLQKATRKWGIVKLSMGLDWLQTFVLK